MALDSKSVSFCVASCMNILRHMGVSSVAVLIAISVSLAPDRAHAYAPVPCPNRFLTMPDYPPAGGSAPAPTGNLTDGSASARHLIHANNLITPPQTWGTSMADSLQNITYSLAAGEIAGGVAINAAGRLINAVRSGNAAATVAKTPTTVFRQGTFADEAIGWEGNIVKGKQWATDNPLTTPNYAKRYGLPAENTGKPDWVVGGRTQGSYTTRPAPASHNFPANTGGAAEVLPQTPNDVILDWFHMP